jgi:hypothetical protein
LFDPCRCGASMNTVCALNRSVIAGLLSPVFYVYS